MIQAKNSSFTSIYGVKKWNSSIDYNIRNRAQEIKISLKNNFGNSIFLNNPTVIHTHTQKEAFLCLLHALHIVHFSTTIKMVFQKLKIIKFYCTVPTPVNLQHRTRQAGKQKVFLQLSCKISMTVINVSLQHAMGLTTGLYTNHCYKIEHSQTSFSIVEGSTRNLVFVKDIHLS